MPPRYDKRLASLRRRSARRRRNTAESVRLGLLALRRSLLLGDDHVGRTDRRLGPVAVVDWHVRGVGHTGTLVGTLDLEVLLGRDVLEFVVLVSDGRVELRLGEGREAVFEQPAR